MLSNFDEYQSRQTAKFTRDTMKRNAEAGFWNGAVPPFGYTAEVAEMRGPKAKKRLAIEPSEALMVQQIYRVKRIGIGQGPMGYKKIVCHLNAGGATLRGRKWHVSNLRDILTRSTYRGIHLYGVHDIRNGVKRPENEWQKVAVPAIISEAEWLEVQAGIARNARHITAPTFVSGPTMLAGIAKCGHPECGHALTIATGKRGRYRYYRCSRNRRRGETACQGTSIRDEKLETIVINAMAERLLRPERLQRLLTNLLDESSSAIRERQAHLKALRTERTRVEGTIQNIFDFIEQGVVSPRDTDFTTRLAAQRTRRADLEQEIVLVERQLSATDRSVTPEAIGRLGDVIIRSCDRMTPYSGRATLVDSSTRWCSRRTSSQSADRSSRSKSPPAAIPSTRHPRCPLLTGSGAPERTRTSDLRFRKPSLYPAELRGLGPIAKGLPGGGQHGRPADGRAPERDQPFLRASALCAALPPLSLFTMYCGSSFDARTVWLLILVSLVCFSSTSPCAVPPCELQLTLSPFFSSLATAYSPFGETESHAQEKGSRPEPGA